MFPRAPKFVPSRETLKVAQLPLLWALCMAATAGFGLLVTIHAGNGSGWTAFQDLGETLAAVIAALACAGRARRDHRESAAEGGSQNRDWRAWRLLAYGMGVWAVGHAARSVCEVGFGI
ncbi:MAG TPA: hypothetical protein VNY34_00865, partial [Solirubrobacteraceae bacterium]|nr:hypothetical protein [Solirubrobacteraceae bacterium]